MRNICFLLLMATLSLVNQTAVSATQPAFVELQTNLGTITMKLDYANAPISAANFIAYVQSGFYKNTLIHRLVKGFVVQGGGYSKLDGKLKTTSAPIVNESNNGLSNLTATVAMARTNDPNSATSQFFINLVDNTGLDYSSVSNPGYAVFAEVIEGMAVVRKIENLATFSSLPFTGASSLVFIENVYSSYVFDTGVSKTRIMLSGQGNVVSEPAGINCGKSCFLSRTASGTIKLTAAAAAGHLFSGWRGDCRGNQRVISIDAARGNHNCTAVFSKIDAAVQ